jgi:hypothetical protein
MGRGPIFLAGADRSGTTLTYALLASHPNIAIAHLGSNMWTFFFGQHGDLGRPENFERCLAAMLQYKHVQILNPNPDRIRKEFWQGPTTYARLFALIQDHYAEQSGKQRWGDKTSYIERYADPIFAAYPTAKMIHMIRDPRDRYASAITIWPHGRGQVGGATARWLYSVRLANRNQRRHSDRYKVVRYETLVSQPEETLREICTFLGEDYDPAMLTMQGAERFLHKGGNSSYGKHGQGAISTAPIGRFRKTISGREIAFIQAYAKRDMIAYNYVLDPVRFSISDHLRFYFVDWPTNRSRMVAWRTLETLQQRFPAQIGRTPLHSGDQSRRKSE